jgi:hypothetical protein
MSFSLRGVPRSRTRPSLHSCLASIKTRPCASRISSRSTRTRRSASFRVFVFVASSCISLATKLVSPRATSLASSDNDFASFEADANAAGSTPCARNHAASDSREPPVQDAASSGGAAEGASEPRARADIATRPPRPPAQVDVYVHAVR